MINTAEIKVTSELLDNSDITDDYLFREVAHKLITHMPIKELHKLIKFKKTDPFSEESRDLLRNYSLPEYERTRIRLLQEMRMILFEGQCNLE